MKKLGDVITIECTVIMVRTVEYSDAYLELKGKHVYSAGGHKGNKRKSHQFTTYQVGDSRQTFTVKEFI